jgi:leucyl aminopeptidase
VNIDQEDGAEHLAVARACNVSRWLTALPPNVLRMDPFYNLLRDTFLGKPGVTLLGDNRNGEPTQEEYTRMGLLNAVAQGNGGYRRVFAIRIDPESGPTEEVNAYVGKTLIFDAGGYNNKGTHARGMKGDMGGGARVYGAARYFMDNRHLLKRSVVFVWTITKNMIGPDGYTPDDVVTAFSDKTVEIDNTDAEGRLALSDAIAWICTKVKIQRVIAVCTLTGAVGVALGVSATGMHLKNSRRRLNEVGRLEDLSFQCGDPVNVLHHFGEGARLLRSSIADIKNSSGGKRDAGSQQGFAFLLAHTPEEVDLMELDIAGSSGDFSDSDGIQPGTSRPAGTAFLIAMETSDLANAA